MFTVWIVSIVWKDCEKCEECEDYSLEWCETYEGSKKLADYCK